MKSAKLFLYLWISLLVVLLCVDVPAGQSQTQILEGIRADGRADFVNSEGRILASIAVEIADTPQTRMQGLMWRTGLDDTMGMLFVYKDTVERGFWMHNTPTALDIVFIAENGRVIRIAADTAPMSDTMHFSRGPAKYVVEVAAGFCKRYGIVEGVVMKWQRK